MLIPWIILLFRKKLKFVQNYRKTIAKFQQTHVVMTHQFAFRNEANIYMFFYWIDALWWTSVKAR